MRVLGPAAGGLGVQTDVLRSPPTRGARVTWALLDGVGTGFWGASGDLDIACPSHPEVIMKKDCGMRGRGAKEAHVFGAAALCLRRVVTTRERISTE